MYAHHTTHLPPLPLQVIMQDEYTACVDMLAVACQAFSTDVHQLVAVYEVCVAVYMRVADSVLGVAVPLQMSPLG